MNNTVYLVSVAYVTTNGGHKVAGALVFATDTTDEGLLVDLCLTNVKNVSVIVSHNIMVISEATLDRICEIHKG